MRISVCILLLCAVVQAPVQAWDAVGHRLSAAIALTHLSFEKQEALREILMQHPRYQPDFLAAMPASVSRADAGTQWQWLFGQAAYWPDIARNLPEADALRFNRPAWHFIDGAWVRGAAMTQGNVYIQQQAFADVAGEPATSIRSESQAQNVMTALDFNSRVLADRNRSMEERAVALCWVLHLMGDIHQPLHAGSLFSPNLFRTGDRGGNGIPTNDGNLHARWDRALADAGFRESLAAIQAEQGDLDQSSTAGADSDWSQWLAESRQILHSQVYSDSLRAAISDADRRGTALPAQALDPAYVQTMQGISRQRLSLAGRRMAVWFESAL